MIYDIFKIGIYRVELKIDNNQLIKYSHDLQKYSKGEAVTNSNKGGFHSKDLTSHGKYNVDSKILKTLIKNINTHVNKYAKELGYSNTSLDNIWCNINYYKDYNDIHSHPGAKISGVYYVKTPKDCGDITFYSPSFREVQQAELGGKNNHYTSQTWWLPAVEGLLYLFPSYLLHTVMPNLNKNEERISYSFNY